MCPVAPASSRIAVTGIVNTGCGLISTNVECPAAIATRIGGVELHGPAQVVVPVVGGHARRVHPVPGQRRHETDVAGLRGHAGQVGAELLGDLLHRHRVRRVVHRNQPGPDRLGLHACTRSATGCGGPDTTTVAGPFTAATPTPGNRARRAATASADRSTDAIAPVPRSTARARERSATVLAASSRDRIPATHAAPISPCE